MFDYVLCGKQKTKEQMRTVYFFIFTGGGFILANAGSLPEGHKGQYSANVQCPSGHSQASPSPSAA